MDGELLKGVCVKVINVHFPALAYPWRTSRNVQLPCIVTLDQEIIIQLILKVFKKPRNHFIIMVCALSGCFHNHKIAGSTFLGKHVVLDPIATPDTEYGMGWQGDVFR